MMRLVIHPEADSDIFEIIEYYEQTANAELADEFYRELRRLMMQAVEWPESFAIRVHDLRRVNLSRFPYHFLFRVAEDQVQILVVRHHRRHPSFGIERR